MPKGQRKNSKKKGVVRRKSRTQKNKKSTMKGGSVDDSTTWTATDQDGGKWLVESGTKIEEIYKLDNNRLHILKVAEKAIIDALFTKDANGSATRANLNAIQENDEWKDVYKIDNYTKVEATEVKNDEAKKLQSVTLTFTDPDGVQPFPEGPVTFVLLDVNK